jgi:quinol monooxygenase YgiN
LITRVVKLTFKPEFINEFITIFKESKSFIKSFEGNVYLALMNDKNNKNTFFTISQWESEEALNAYRQSDYFQSVWSRTKALFEEKADAWTLDQIECLGKWQNQ